MIHKIKEVAILGACAMGAYFAASFFDAGYFSTALLARDQRCDRLKNEGPVVN